MSNKNNNYVLNLCLSGCCFVNNKYKNENDRCLCNDDVYNNLYNYVYNYVYWIIFVIVFGESLTLTCFLLLFQSENYMETECSAPYINLFLLLLLNIYLLTTLCFSKTGGYQYDGDFGSNEDKIIIYERCYLKVAYIINLFFRVWSFVSYLYLIINMKIDYEEIIHNEFNNITNETYTTISITKIDNKYIKCINDKLLGALLMSSIILLVVLTCITLYGVVEFIKCCDEHIKERIKKNRESELETTKVKLKTTEQKIEELETKLRITESKLNDNANIIVAEVLIKEDV